MAEKTGKLLAGGAPDVNNVCKTIIMDWQRGNIPYFTRPPKMDNQAEDAATKDPAAGKTEKKELTEGEGENK